MRFLPPTPSLRWVTVALVVAGCANEPTSIPSSTVTSPLRMSANVSGTPISTIAVTVSANDIHEPLVFNIVVANGIATGTIDVPPGHARTFSAQGFDATGTVTHEGSTVMDVVKGTNPPIALTMRPRSGQVSVTVTVGSIGLTVSPASFGLVESGIATKELTASPTDQAGAPIAGAVVTWGSSNPAIATVSTAGVVTAHAPGSAQIVASYGGVASTSTLTVASGSVIVFSREQANGGGIFAVNADGTGERQLTSGFQDGPVWSPDHRKIAMYTAGSIWVMDPDGTNQTRLTNAGVEDALPNWSPDGTRIVFKRASPSEYYIWTMNADGTNQRQFTAGPARHDLYASWSPDGLHIAVMENETGPFLTWIFNADGTGTGTQIARDLLWPAWSPDGSLLALDNGLSIFTEHTTDGSALETVALLTARNQMAAWSPDGSRIAFVHSEGNSASIYVMNADGSDVHRVSSGTADFSPSWR